MPASEVYAPGWELREERDIFFRRATYDFRQRTWKVIHSPDPDYKKGASFTHVEVTIGLSGVALRTGCAWPNGMVFEIRQRKLRVVHPARKERSCTLVDVDTGRTFPITGKLENYL